VFPAQYFATNFPLLLQDLTAGAPYSNALHKHVQQFSHSAVVRNSDSVLTITVPKYVSYSTVALGSETVSAIDIPAVALLSTTDLTALSGTFTIEIRTRTIVYSGSLFAQTELDDGKIRGAEVTHSPYPHWHLDPHRFPGETCDAYRLVRRHLA
jgi:hypothetical protein